MGGTGGVAFRSCQGAGPRPAHSGGCTTASFTAQAASRAVPSPPPPLCPSACAAKTRRAVPRPGECSRPRGGAQASLVEEWGRRVGVLLGWCGKGCGGAGWGQGCSIWGAVRGAVALVTGARSRACVERHGAGAQAAPARCGWDAQVRRGRVRGAGQRAPALRPGSAVRVGARGGRQADWAGWRGTASCALEMRMGWLFSCAVVYRAPFQIRELGYGDGDLRTTIKETTVCTGLGDK